MITGIVNKKLETEIDMPVYGPTKTYIDAHFIIDTGFDGEISLPPDAIATLGLRRAWPRRTIHADGRSVYTQTYRARISWDDELRDVIVNPTERYCLIGAQLLKGFRMTADFVPGATVTIERISTQRA